MLVILTTPCLSFPYSSVRYRTDDLEIYRYSVDTGDRCFEPIWNNMQQLTKLLLK